MADIIPMRRPVETGFVGPHRYSEYEGLYPPEYPPSPEYQPVDLPAESRLFDPEIDPFMNPELIATIERRREQEKELEILRTQVDARLEALPEEQKPAARKWLAESRARTAPAPVSTAKPTTREEASQMAISKIGFDPDLTDPNKIIQQQFQQGLPKVIQSVFKKGPGQLTPQENEYLQKEIIPMFQKQVINSVSSKIRAGQGYYKRAMTEFDTGQKVKEAERKVAIDARKYIVEQERKDREEARKIVKEGKVDEKEIRTTLQKEYDRYKKTHPDYKGSIIDFKKTLQAKEPTVKGELTEGTVLKSIDDLCIMSDDPTKCSADAYNKYLNYRKTEGRERALNKVRQEMQQLETRTIGRITFEKRADGKWYPRQ